MDKITLQQRMRWEPKGMHIREKKDGGESRTIEGCAIVFNTETTLWDGKYERVRETIAPSCVTEEFLREQDIKLNLLHERDNTIARCNKGQGNLVLDLREDGLYFSAELPECDICDRALAMVRSGVYSGCSFEFLPKDYTEQTTTLEDGREDTLITHTAFESVQALTVAMDPAYEQTSVGLREQMQAREAKHITNEGDPDSEAKQREAEEAEKAAKAAELTRAGKLREYQRDLELTEAENGIFN